MQPEAPREKQEKQSTEILKRIWNTIKRRPFMKISALLIAVAFWAVVIASDPTLPIEKTILNAPVTVTGLETLRSRGLTVMDDLSSGTITVKMRVQVKQADYEKATAEAFSPRLELAQQISHEGKQHVFFSVASTTYGTVLSFEPEFVELEVEQYISRSRVPIVTQLTGESEASLWITNVTTDPSQVAVSGPKSLVDRIQRAAVFVPRSGLSEKRPHDGLSGEIILQDANETQIISSQLRVTSESITVDSARVEMDVYPMRDIPVNAESLVTGIPAHGYKIADVRVTPEAISVAADAETLSELEAMYIASPVDVSGMSASITQTAALRGVSGLTHIASQEVTVEVDIVPAPHVHTYINLPVTVMGLSGDLTAKLSQAEMDLILRGDYDQVQGLLKDDITLFVDATGLDVGSHLLRVQCLVNGTDAYTFEPEMDSVTLTLTRETTAE